MIEFFERVDKFSAWNLWRVGKDVSTWDHAMKFWKETAVAPAVFDTPAFRPISEDRARALIKIGI